MCGYKYICFNFRTFGSVPGSPCILFPHFSSHVEMRFGLKANADVNVACFRFARPLLLFFFCLLFVFMSKTRAYATHTDILALKKRYHNHCVWNLLYFSDCSSTTLFIYFKYNARVDGTTWLRERVD